MSCTKPDRDVPKLVCGYPLPCPHHTLVLEQEAVLEGNAIPMVSWIAQYPSISIGHFLFNPGADGGPSFEPTNIGVRAIAFLGSVEIWRGERSFPLATPMRDLRDAFDELTREGHLELETAVGKQFGASVDGLKLRTLLGTAVRPPLERLIKAVGAVLADPGISRGLGLPVDAWAELRRSHEALQLMRTGSDRVVAAEPITAARLAGGTGPMFGSLCVECDGTGVVETGNNDLPCTCAAGDVAVFNTGNGRMTGAEIKQVLEAHNARANE